MKIAILAHLKYAIAQPFAGGLEMHTHLLAESLIRRGHAVTLFAAKGSTPRAGLRAVCDPTGEGHGDAGTQMIVDFAEASAYRAMMDDVADGGFDVIHNNSLHPHPLRVAHLLGAPMVTTLHTPPFEPLAAAMASGLRNVALVAVSVDLAGHWVGIVDDIGVIPNGIDLTVFHPVERRAAPPHAFWFGRIVPEKGLHLAIDAARSAGLPLRFAGPRLDDDYWAAEIEPRLGDDLTSLGHLAHATLARQLSRARVAIISPCWDEPFGLVVAEALACGTPVAAFARGAIPSLIDPRCGSLARPGDSADLARAIVTASGMDRAACRAHAEQWFDGERMVDRYEALYGRLIARTRPGRAKKSCATPTTARDEAVT
jgi:glycosyltransferase involved in cell wall biosynthesis